MKKMGMKKMSMKKMSMKKKASSLHAIQVAPSIENAGGSAESSEDLTAEGGHGSSEDVTLMEKDDTPRLEVSQKQSKTMKKMGMKKMGMKKMSMKKMSMKKKTSSLHAIQVA